MRGENVGEVVTEASYRRSVFKKKELKIAGLIAEGVGNHIISSTFFLSHSV